MTNDEIRKAAALPRQRLFQASNFVIPSSYVLRHSSFAALSSLCFLALLTFPQPLLACAACFGASDSNQAKGMNMGIFALLAVVVVVLGGIASFFIYLARRASAQSAPSQPLQQIS
jgi:hypothetical protein